MSYAIIQDGGCMWGKGETINECITDANAGADPEQQILLFAAAYGEPVPADSVAFIQDSMARSPRRRFEMAYGFYITNDPSVILDYTFPRVGRFPACIPSLPHEE